MKPPVSPELRRRVLELRHRHTLRETAELTGLPLGTIKTLCSRSGAFRDNPAHRALFSLPPIQPSEQTLPASLDLPPQVQVTGDREVDAVLWLRQVIETGQPALIDRAMTAAQRIATPLKDLEKRYAQHLSAAKPGNEFAVLFATLGFADLEDLARKTIERERLRCEAEARFGDALFADTDAETFCVGTLAGLECGGTFLEYDDQAVAARFQSHPELLPNTLADCVHELSYWSDLHRLRQSVDDTFLDGPPEARARESFVFGLLAWRRPRTKSEAVAVFRYLADSERMDLPEASAILLNLIGPTPG